MSPSRSSLVTYVRSALREQADPKRAPAMQAYMKTEMPFYGVQKPGRTKILRDIRTEYVPTTREKYDAARLFRYCEKRAHEKEFFIRKAIGWALRDYARTEPEAVARFVSEHREELSGLSYREATKHIEELVR